MPTFRDEAGLIGIGMTPAFGINQRALLVPNGQGNVLWDCVSLVSDVMADLIRGIGGLRAYPPAGRCNPEERPLVCSIIHLIGRDDVASLHCLTWILLL
jgi:hypothetical protein